MTSIILAGGGSSRFGQAKSLKTMGGKSLIQWVVESLTPLSQEIFIVVAQRKSLPYSSPQVKVIEDIYPGKGPLEGIYSGLAASSSPRAIVVGCDMPFLNSSLLGYMACLSPGFDVVVPRIGEWLEPLCAVYSRDCLIPIRRLLEHNELAVRKLFNLVSVRYVFEKELKTFDPHLLSLFNVNTKERLAEVRNKLKTSLLASSLHDRPLPPY
jgi:molybdopterin-guanine dinucleotide biosynthesis protein A